MLLTVGAALLVLRHNLSRLSRNPELFSLLPLPLDPSLEMWPWNTWQEALEWRMEPWVSGQVWPARAEEASPGLDCCVWIIHLPRQAAT